jgi:hypothetical protein
VYSRLRTNEARLSGNESAREDHAKYVDRPIVADGIPAPSSTVKGLGQNHWYRLHLDPEDPYEILFKPWHAPEMTNTLFAPGLKLNSQGYYIVRDKNRDAVATLTLGRSYRWQEYTPSFQEHVLKDLISDAQELTRQAPPRVTRRINQN